MRFETTDRWKNRWPGAVVACMVVTGVTNPVHGPSLDERLDQIEHRLRERYAGVDRATLRAMMPFAAYERYTKQFGQTYHVWRQIESVALKGNSIPRRAALVEAVFASELDSGLLTAVHDARVVTETVIVDTATGNESMDRFDGTTSQLVADDMFMRDERAILSSVIKGPAGYGMVTAETVDALVTVYAPEGIGADAVIQHLEEIAMNVRLIAVGATISFCETTVA